MSKIKEEKPTPTVKSGRSSQVQGQEQTRITDTPKTTAVSRKSSKDVSVEVTRCCIGFKIILSRVRVMDSELEDAFDCCS